MKTAALLACLVAVAGAASAEDEDRLTVERLVKGDCPHYLRLGEGGPSLLRLGRFGYLGVETTALTPELRRHFGAPEDAGVLIGRVEEGSPAEAAGLQVGDIVTRVDDGDVTSGGRLRRLVRGYEKDERATLEYWRGGKVAETTVAFDERQSCGLDLGSMIDFERLPRIDLDRLPKIDFDKLPRYESLLELQEFDGEKLDEAREYLRKAYEVRQVDAEELQEAEERLREALRNQDWRRHLERIRDVDLTDIEERLRKAMDRLHELEHEIDVQKEKIHRHDGEPDA